MSHTVAIISEIALVITVTAAICMIMNRRLSKKNVMLIAVVFAWLGVFSALLSLSFNGLTETVTITGTGRQNEKSYGNAIYLDHIIAGGKTIEITGAVKGAWSWFDISGTEYYTWLPKGDERRAADATDSIDLAVPVGTDREIGFLSDTYGGIAEVVYNGKSHMVDLYKDVYAMPFAYQLESSTDARLKQNQLLYFKYFCAVFLTMSLFVSLLFWLIYKKFGIDKLSKHKFLFQELVKRDFTLKYKRTVLGMMWSILSPLFNLVIMWIIFSKLLGSNVDHYVIYLFSGQIIFSFFSDATSQGMTSLLDNSGIFTKVNVPKYMFLLSKNISSLMNFGLTLIILFIFVAFEGLPFTWKFLMLIYPMGCLIIFNIGLGLILSALFVFFRDMQYLWSICTQLIMWLSAIFYSIESFPMIGQNLFLLNPIYLFIRYFRKILIDSTVPSLWFHLMIAGYTIVVLFIGYRMYKKNNHEFLYYI